MSEEKITGNTINVNALPSCLDEPIKAVLTPSAKEIGGFFGDLLSIVTGKVHFTAEKRRIQQEHDLQVFKDGLIKKLEEKPTDCLTEPRLQVVGPAIERAAYCMGEDQIREMFQNLIANAADSRYNQKVHPSFSAIIEQLTPLDAENLKLFSDKKHYPIVNYRIVASNGSATNHFEDCFLANPKMIRRDALELQAASIGSLKRQGLLEITYMEHLTSDDYYQPFREHSLMDKTRQLADILTVAHQCAKETADIEKGIVRITPFGQSFIEVCF